MIPGSIVCLHMIRIHLEPLSETESVKSVIEFLGRLNINHARRPVFFEPVE